MDKSLDDYISSKPTLHAAIARLGNNCEQQIHDSELKVVSRHYVCSEMDVNSDPENEKVHGIAKKNNNCNVKSAAPLNNSVEEAYLALDLNEEDKLINEWYEQINSNVTKGPTVMAKECADLSNGNEMQNKNDLNNGQPSYRGVSNEIVNLLKQPGFDLRQKIGRNNRVEQDFLPKKFYNNINNKRKQTRGGTNKNYFIRNNAPYQNKRNSNGYFGNGINSHTNEAIPCPISGNNLHLWHNRNTCSPITGNSYLGLGSNSGCCSYAVPAPINLCQSSLCNGNSFLGNGLNFNMHSSANPVGSLGFGCNAFGCKDAGAFNTSMRLTQTCNNGGNNFDVLGSAENTFNKSLNNAACCAGNLDVFTSQRANVCNKAWNMSEAVNQGGRQENTEINGNNSMNSKAVFGSACVNQGFMNTTDIHMEHRGNENNKSTTERKNIASMLGITSKDLEINSVPVMLEMMQEILKNGVTINMFMKKHS